MHTSMQLGSMILMGCDAPPSGRDQAIGGFQIAVESSDKEQIKRLFAELSAGGSVQIPLGSTFWTLLFGMLKDRFGVGWMLSIPGPEPNQ